MLTKRTKILLYGLLPVVFISSLLTHLYDVPLPDWSNELLSRFLHYQPVATEDRPPRPDHWFLHPENVSMIEGTTIPKIIHFTWKSDDPTTLPEDIQAVFASWEAFNPTYTRHIWTDEEALDLVETWYPDLLPVYLSLPRGAYRADLWRYLVLHKYGGVYVDMDVECRQPIDTWLKGKEREEGWEVVDGIVGIELDFVEGEHWVNSDGSRNHPAIVRPINLVQWTTAFAPGHPVLQHAVGLARENIQWANSIPPSKTPHLVSENTSLLQKLSLELAGPPVLTDAFAHWSVAHHRDIHGFTGLKEAVTVGGVRVMTQTAFSPQQDRTGPWGRTHAHNVDHKDCLAVHHFMFSWFDQIKW